MELCSALWAAGIKAEFGYKPNPKVGGGRGLNAAFFLSVRGLYCNAVDAGAGNVRSCQRGSCWSSRGLTLGRSGI